MSRRIVIEPVTRIEGHARISVHLDDAGNVESARFHVTEFRGFEKFCEGRPFSEMPGIMSRVCGICPVSHILASSKAGDMLLGVGIPVAARKQRQLAGYAQILQSHALSFFHLASPDLLLGMDAPAAERNFLGVFQRDENFLRRGIRLRQFGQNVVEMVGGKRIHPAWSGPGGVHQPVPRDQCGAIFAGIPEALESVSQALDRLKQLFDTFRPEIDNMGDFPSLFLGTVNPQGGLEYYDGTLKIVDAAGNCVAEGLDPAQYFTYLGETSEPWSYMKSSFYRPLGSPDGCYRVGPLARLNVAAFAGTPRADRELTEFKQRSQGAVCQSFHYHLARLVEMLHAVERIEELMSGEELYGEDVQARAALNRREGIGSCEAPRGTLFHRYCVDADGLMTHADLLIATSQNNLPINRAVTQAARHFLRHLEAGADPDEGVLNRLEAAIRCFDPCLSCSTHALGDMPLEVEFIGADGAILHSIARPG